jgi:TfoX/Sxy family transcriptional regulator of competence genes
VKTPPPPALVRAFDDAVQRLRGVERRKMFGYPAIFVNGNMFAGLVRDKMVLRLGVSEVEKFLVLPGAAPFIAMGGRRMRQWAVVPTEMVASRRALAPWLAKALAHGRSLPKKGRTAKAVSTSAGIRRIPRGRR